ncbi:MAG: hypothetical protein IPP34_02960 [Bacteroidetes bacterium]|nr:hypothetical protein [Bacteroidota bacterium]
MRKLRYAIYGLPYYISISYWRKNYKNIITTFFAIFGLAWTFVEAANHFKMAIAVPETTSFFFTIVNRLCTFLVNKFPKLYSILYNRSILTLRLNC